MAQQTTTIAEDTKQDLAALVGSRLCHDLVSPLGAIGNGVELLTMSGDYPGLQDSPELRLIMESVASAQRRIQTFRMAFGHAPADQRISRVELEQLTDAVSGQGRIRVSLDAAGDFARAEVRMLMLALMCLETAMPWGGQILAVHLVPGWRLVAESDRMRSDPALWSWLDGPATGPRITPAPSEVHFPLLAELAGKAGRRLQWEIDESGAEIRF